MKKEFNVDYFYDKINDGKISEDEEFYFGGQNINFFKRCAELGLVELNTNFIAFISSAFSTQFFLESKLSIHIDTCNIYYDRLKRIYF